MSHILDYTASLTQGRVACEIYTLEKKACQNEKLGLKVTEEQQVLTRLMV